MSNKKSYEEQLKENICILGEDLGRLYTDLFKELLGIFLIWKEYKALFGTSQERINLLNYTAPSFFFLIQEIMLSQIVTNIARLTDPPESYGKQNITILALNKYEKGKVIDEEIERLKKEVEPLKEYRNKKIGHLDLDTRRGKNRVLLNINIVEEIDRIIMLIKNVLNKFESTYFNRQVFYEHVIEAGGSSESLLKYLKAGSYFLDLWNEKNRRGEVDPNERRAWRI